MSDQSNLGNSTSDNLTTNTNILVREHKKQLGISKVRLGINNIKVKFSHHLRTNTYKVEGLIPLLDVLISLDLNFIPKFCNFLYHEIGSSAILNTNPPYRVEMNKLILENITINTLEFRTLLDSYLYNI